MNRGSVKISKTRRKISVDIRIFFAVYRGSCDDRETVKYPLLIVVQVRLPWRLRRSYQHGSGRQNAVAEVHLCQALFDRLWTGSTQGVARNFIWGV